MGDRKVQPIIPKQEHQEADFGPCSPLQAPPGFAPRAPGPSSTLQAHPGFVSLSFSPNSPQAPPGFAPRASLSLPMELMKTPMFKRIPSEPKEKQKTNITNLDRKEKKVEDAEGSPMCEIHHCEIMALKTAVASLAAAASLRVQKDQTIPKRKKGKDGSKEYRKKKKVENAEQDTKCE